MSKRAVMYACEARCHFWGTSAVSAGFSHYTHLQSSELALTWVWRIDMIHVEQLSIDCKVLLILGQGSRSSRFPKFFFVMIVIFHVCFRPSKKQAHQIQQELIIKVLTSFSLNLARAFPALPPPANVRFLQWQSWHAWSLKGELPIS